MYQVQGAPDGTGTGIRAKIFALTFLRAAMIAKMRVWMLGRQVNIRVALVITKQDIVTRLVGLDEIVLEYQRLVLGMGNGHLDMLYLFDHDPGFGRFSLAANEIAGHPVFQVFCLADINHLTCLVLHTVDAGSCGQAFQKGFTIKRHAD